MIVVKKLFLSSAVEKWRKELIIYLRGYLETSKS